jgi:hypothetical protein
MIALDLVQAAHAAGTALGVLLTDGAYGLY